MAKGPPEQKTKIASDGPGGLLSGMRCLVLDDEFLIALDTQNILEVAGAADVVTLNTVEAALKAVTDGPCFDFAVLDLKLGGEKTSLPVAAMLAGQKTPFVFLTGLSREGLHSREFPGTPLVQKPFRDEILLAALRTALGR